jgi:hypothetical protein
MKEKNLNSEGFLKNFKLLVTVWTRVNICFWYRGCIRSVFVFLVYCTTVSLDAGDHGGTVPVCCMDEKGLVATILILFTPAVNGEI